MKVLILTAHGFEDTELLCPMYRLKEAGYQVDVAAPEWGEVRGKHGYGVSANLTLDEVEPTGYKLLLIPGGKAPGRLRTIPRALDIARAFSGHRIPIAAICHGPQVLMSAGLIQGKRATCYRKISRELVVAKGLYEDSEVVVDDGLITSREPADLPAFMREIMKALGRGNEESMRWQGNP